MLKKSETIGFFCIKASAYAGILLLLAALALIGLAGYRVISWQFLTGLWQHQDIAAGGIWPAILGSFYLGVGVTLCSFPLGIGAAIYLTEYGRQNFWRRSIEVAIRNLAGVPSVVYGLFGLGVFVYLMRLGTSLLAAVLTLSAMTLPWIITAAVEALQAVPPALRESSLALGATKWQTIKHIVLPLALPASLTGGIVGIARAMGETAPIIIVGATFYLTTLPSSPLDKFMALPYHAFILATQHSDARAVEYASGTALVLIVLVFILSLGAIILRYYFRSKYKIQ